MRSMRGLAALACLAVGAMLLTACGSTYQQRAYALGQTYDLIQDGSITYMKTPNAKLATIDRIADADAKASPQVQNVLQCAEELQAIEDGTAPPDPMAVSLGLSASEVADAKSEACDGALARANGLVDMLGNLMGGE